MPLFGSPILPKSIGAHSLLNRPLACLARGRSCDAPVPRLATMSWMWWWVVEFIFLDIVATFALLFGYLAVVIRKAVV